MQAPKPEDPEPQSQGEGAPKDTIGARRRSRFDRTSGLCKYFPFFALGQLRRVHARRLVDMRTLDTLAAADDCRLLGSRLAAQMAKMGPNAALLRALARLLWPQVALAGLLHLGALCLLLPLQMVALGWLIADLGRYLAPSRDRHSDSDSAPDAFEGVVGDALLLSAALLAYTLCEGPYRQLASHLALKCRVAASSLVYRKATRLPVASMGSTSVGRLANLLSSDVHRFDEFVPVATSLLVAPLQAAVVLLLLARLYVGLYPTLAALAALLLCLLLQTLFGRTATRLRARSAPLADRRLRLLHETLGAIKLIKMCACLEPVERLAASVRERELRLIGRSAAFHAANFVLFQLSQRLVAFVALTTFVLLGNTLRPEVAFVTLGLTNSIRASLTLQLPAALGFGAETLVAARRIDDFLSLAELECGGRTAKATPAPAPAPGSLELAGLWRALSLRLEPGELLVVLGGVGAGKSSLLMAMLGERAPQTGSVRLQGRVSFAPQQPWLLSASVRDNVLLGRLFDPIRYQQVMRVCALERDLELLPDADRSQVGERGLSLSGSQRARLNLARALYHEADVYVLDEPLAAVDAPLAAHIFREAFQSLLAHKTVVVATHQHQFAQLAAKVLLLDRAQAPVLATGPDQIGALTLDKSLEQHPSPANATRHATQAMQLEHCRAANDSTSSLHEQLHREGSMTNRKQAVQFADDQPRVSILAAVAFYLRAFGGPVGCGLVGLLALLPALVTALSDYTLSLWTDSLERRSAGPNALGPHTLIDRLSSSDWSIVYSALIGLLLVTTAIYAGSFFFCAIRASRSIHRSLFSGVSATFMSFFDFRPLGSILARFSSDLGYVDELLPYKALATIQIALLLLAGPLLMSLLNPFVWIATLAMFGSLYALHRWFGSSLILLQRAEAAARARLLSHLSNTLAGLAPIRALGAQAEFERKFEALQNEHSRLAFALLTSCAMLCLAVEWLMRLFVLAVLLLTLGLPSLACASASQVGLTLALALALPDPVRAGFLHLIQVEGHFSCVQRIAELCRLPPETEPPSERQQSLDTHSLAAINLLQGRPPELRFVDVTLRYFADEPPVLSGLNFSVDAGEKVAIVGRTGAGKSSIVSALFRLYPFEGSVELNRLDTKRMMLRHLRSAISVIPQEPVLLSASLRKNLDPFERHSNSAIWAALEAVQLRALFESQGPLGLESEICDAGAKLSVGQRQLVCLARAILSRNRMLVFDEATANVDPQTDAAIQRTIAREFAHCTVITIARRLLTVVDASRVLVLQSGLVREFDDPYKLMQNKLSLFSQIIDSNQAELAAQLRRLIELSYRKRVAERQTFGSLAFTSGGL